MAKKKSLNQYLKEIKKDLTLNKEGLMLGAIVGFIVAQFQKSNPVIVNAMIETQGLIDNYLDGTSVEVAAIKTTIMYVLVFAYIGYLGDKFIYPKR